MITYRDNLIFAKKGDIILPLSGETPLDISNSAVIPVDGVALGGDLIALRTNLNPLFLSYQLSGKRKLQIARLAQGKSIVHSNPNQLMKLWIFYPTTKEQDKIAKTLFCVSKKIGLITRKLKALKKYKKGIINSWFKNVGNAVKLCELVKCQSSQLVTNQITDNLGIYPVFDATGSVYKTINFYLNSNDSIVIIKYGSGCGRTFIAYDKHCVLGTMSELIPLNHNDLTYLFAFTESSKFKNICKKYTEVGTTPNLYYSDYSKELVYYPAERRTFINLVKLINEKSANLEEEEKKLKLLKRQLLKDMFI